MVLALAIAGMQVEGETLISDAEMVEKSFENFIPDMIKVGANLELVEKKSWELFSLVWRDVEKQR